MRSLSRRLATVVLLALSVPALADFGGTTQFDNHVVHYSALSTDLLNAQMAEQYAIERSADRGLVNLSVQKVAADETANAVAATITGEATNLAGQTVEVTIREIPGQYVSYIGLFDLVAPDTYTFTFSIKPDGAKRAETLRFTQDFVAR